MEPVPFIDVSHKIHSLYVHKEPFIAIGVEVDFRNSMIPERLERLYPHAGAMGCTTLFVPVFWSQVERVPGRFDFSFVDRQLVLAARYGLKLGLLWFGSNRGGSMCFPNLPGTDGKPAGETVQVPPDVFADPTRYRRACRAAGEPADSLCPTCEATLDREMIAFRFFMRHLALADTDRTVVLIQVENEVSTPETGHLQFADRCFCPVCSEQHARSGLTDREFCDRSYGDFVAALVEAGAEEHPVPFYVNFVSAPRPGENITYYLERAPHLASCAPDIYAGDTASFRRTLRSFAVGRNVPLVAETSSDTKDPSDRTVWYAVCESGAVGFVLWAVDCAYGLGAWEDGYAHRTPLVGPDGAWSVQAFRTRDEFSVLGRVMAPLCRNRGTDRLQWFVAEGAPLSLPVTIPGVHGTIEVAADGRGLVVLTGPGEITLAGHGFGVRLEGFTPSTATSGGWSGREFVPDGRPVKLAAEGTRVRVSLESPGVVRVSLPRD